VLDVQQNGQKYSSVLVCKKIINIVTNPDTATNEHPLLQIFSYASDLQQPRDVKKKINPSCKQASSKLITTTDKATFTQWLNWGWGSRGSPLPHL